MTGQRPFGTVTRTLELSGPVENRGLGTIRGCDERSWTQRSLGTFAIGVPAHAARPVVPRLALNQKTPRAGGQRPPRQTLPPIARLIRQAPAGSSQTRRADFRWVSQLDGSGTDRRRRQLISRASRLAEKRSAAASHPSDRSTARFQRRLPTAYAHRHRQRYDAELSAAGHLELSPQSRAPDSRRGITLVRTRRPPLIVLTPMPSWGTPRPSSSTPRPRRAIRAAAGSLVQPGAACGGHRINTPEGFADAIAANRQIWALPADDRRARQGSPR